MSGFIALPREVLDIDATNAWFPKDLQMAAVYAYLVNKARWEDAESPLPKQKTCLKSGQMVLAQRELAKALGVTRIVVRRILDTLATRSKIALQSSHHGTIVTICDYEELFLKKKDDQPTNQPSISPPSAHHQPNRDKETRRQGDNKDTLVVSNDSEGAFGPLKLVLPRDDSHLQLAEAWNQNRGTLKGVTKVSTQRRAKMKARWTETPDLGYWVGAIQRMAKSSFCQSGTWATFDWLMCNSHNHVKVTEGNYDNRDVVDTRTLREQQAQANMDAWLERMRRGEAQE